MIWDLAFIQEEAEINLLTARSTVPSATLLQTCLQIHSEAKGIYAEACEKYWTTGNFIVEVGNTEPLKWFNCDCVAAVEDFKSNFRLPDCVLCKVRHVTIRGMGSTYYFADGIWMGAGGRFNGTGKKRCRIFAALNSAYYEDPEDEIQIEQAKIECVKKDPAWSEVVTKVRLGEVIWWYRVVMRLDRELFTSE